MEDLEAYPGGWHNISLSFSILQSVFFVATSIGVACVVGRAPGSLPSYADLALDLTYAMLSAHTVVLTHVSAGEDCIGLLSNY